ncbi:HAD-IIB family hydrolase [Vulgatibacter incomptus]|uniref:Haloacid dehalogenase-like hydrolase n=1 Tax=Vulgatibacter incomptus TaxID=1391653 RepID=A0A0K1PDR8_9BACT|nr:HAD-IIB family hydrolase [Vulgatibacter incomptus]AKU91665.1 haloacid dehalogenase-like hydrolase [Vulgatibacter incomptus]
MRTLDHCPREMLAGLRGLLTDFDGTLTTKGRLEAETYAALSELKEAGLFLAVVTGRPAGWGELIARTFPVDACIAESGGVTFVKGRKGAVHRMYYTDDEARRRRDRRKLEKLVAEVCAEVPGAKLSVDSGYTEVALSIDWNEDVKLSQEDAIRIAEACRARGARAVRSSLHVNVWLGDFDKATAADRLLVEVAKAKLPRDRSRFAFIGDAPNDEPLFDAFSASFGVADVKKVRGELEALPSWVTHSKGGEGFQELAAAILVAKELIA